MSGFTQWLQQSALNNALESSAYWIIPLTQTIHILSIAAVISSMIMVNGRLIRPSLVNLTIPQATSRFLPWMWIALVLLFLTGLMLVVLEPARTLGKTIFWLKMAAIAIAAIMTGLLHRDVRRRPDRWTGDVLRTTITSFAGLNMLLWVFIVFAGRWIAYS